MPKIKKSKKVNSFANKVKSLGKLANPSSRQTHSHSNVPTSHQLHIRTNRIGQRSHLTNEHSNSSHILRSQDAHSFHRSQYTYGGLLYSGGCTHLSPYSRPSNSTTNTKVLVIEDVDKGMGASKSKSVLNKMPEGDSDAKHLLEKISVNFDDVASHQEKFAHNEASRAKAKKFVMAWRAGLSYPRTKKDKVLTDIPIAATSHCKSGITSCTRCYRRHSNRLARSSNENLLADLVHKESLEKFIEETEQFHATSSIVIREDLKRKQLYDCIHHADSADKVDRDGRKSIQLSDDDMQLTIKFTVPPPVHINYIPEKSLFQKDKEKLADLRSLSKKSFEIRQSFSLTHAHKLSLLKKMKRS